MRLASIGATDAPAPAVLDYQTLPLQQLERMAHRLA